MGTVRDTRDGEGGAGLRFEAYETAAPPGTSANLGLACVQFWIVAVVSALALVDSF